VSVLGRFDKAHLVPFCEYVPWPLKRVLERLVNTPYELMAGEPRGPLSIPSRHGPVPIAVTVCFESAFAEISRAQVEGGAELLINVTNDAWYGVSSAPYQHLSLLSMRATENGRSIARAANSGISARIDPFGRVESATRLFEKAAPVGPLVLSSERTVYTRFGDLIGSGSLGLSLWLALLALRPRPRPKLGLVDRGLRGLGMLLLGGGFFALISVPLGEATQSQTALMLALSFGLLIRGWTLGLGVALGLVALVALAGGAGGGALFLGFAGLVLLRTFTRRPPPQL
jgi:hypothetical protein